MLGVVRRAELPLEARATGEPVLGGEAVSRRLAAIVAADVAGYSQLMEADEEGTLVRHKTAGDGMLVEFASAVGAAPIAAS
jgi:adenylate cyclase